MQDRDWPQSDLQAALQINLPHTPGSGPTSRVAAPRWDIRLTTRSLRPAMTCRRTWPTTGSQRRRLMTLGLVVMALGSASRAETGQEGAPAELGSLARLAAIVPADARLFLEIRDVPSVLRVPGSSPMAALLTDLVVASRPADTRPAGSVDLARLVADAIGLKDPHTIQLMFDQRVGLAADSWSGIGDAVLLAEPANPVALELALAAHLVPASADKPVRFYQITNDHELACDGQWLALGRRTHEGVLFARTVAMLKNKQGPSLRDHDDFRKRMVEISESAQGIFYMRAIESADTGARGRLPGWPAAWPNPVSLVMTAELIDTGVAIDVTGKLADGVPDWQPSELPIDALTKLPASTLAAWTHSINYPAEYAQLNRIHQTGPMRFYIDLLESGQAEGGLSGHLLNHLVGDTLIMVGRHRMRFGDQTLVLPTLAIAVETDDPLAVEQAMQQAARNVVRLLSMPLEEENAFRIERHVIQGGGAIQSIAVGRLFALSTTCEWLNTLELAWTVADRWLIVATNAQAIRDIVTARRGMTRSLPIGRVHQALREVQMRGGSARVLLLAQPRNAGHMIDSWITYLQDRHPEVLTDAWWQRLRKRQRAAGVQLGIVPAKVTPGGVEVDRTFPEWPAHDRLKPGDVIVAVDGKPLDEMRSFAALREAIATREREDRLILTCRRESQTIDVEIPMPADSPADRIHPVELLRQLADVLRPFASASFASWQPTPDTLKAHIELRLQPRAATQPQTQPATQPSGPSVAESQPSPTTPPSTATAPATSPAS